VTLVLLASCVINGDKYPRPRDLVDEWQVDRTRLLAIRAEPAEAVPGEVVTFEALFGSPPDDPFDLSVAWFACPVDDGGSGFGCLTDLGGVDLENPDPAAFEDLGIIGFEPLLPPVYTVPADLLDDLSPEERREGRYVLVQVFGLPPEALDDPENLDFADVKSGYKRLVVSGAETPNHNPDIGAFTVDGGIVPAGAVVHLDWHQPYELGVVLQEGAIEPYVYVDSDGTTESRIEEPYVAWFSTGGQLQESVTLWPYLEATWISPPAPGQESDYGGETVDRGTWYAVLRDRRGGMAWLAQPWVIGGT
jgi:hypothetical protein